MQRFKAIAKLNESGERKILSRKCCVYGADMSRQALLTLARQHNDHIQRETTFPEIAASCRRLLFIHFGDEDKSDNGNYMPTIPRYNAEKYKNFKQECLSYLMSPQLVSLLSIYLTQLTISKILCTGICILVGILDGIFCCMIYD